MADKNWPRGRGEAANLSNLKITTRYLDSDYELFNENLTRGETGLLKVFSLIPKQGTGKPDFRARIDDGNRIKRKEPELDIDITGVSDAVVKDFRAGRNGYVGHHTSRSPNANERIFDVEIATPSGRVFKGEVFFNVTFSVGVTMNAKTGVTANAAVIRATRLTQFRNWLKVLWQRITSLFLGGGAG
jgi:hypothetical protein